MSPPPARPEIETVCSMIDFTDFRSGGFITIGKWHTHKPTLNTIIWLENLTETCKLRNECSGLNSSIYDSVTYDLFSGLVKHRFCPIIHHRKVIP